MSASPQHIVFAGLLIASISGPLVYMAYTTHNGYQGCKSMAMEYVQAEDFSKSQSDIDLAKNNMETACNSAEVKTKAIGAMIN